MNNQPIEQLSSASNTERLYEITCPYGGRDLMPGYFTEDGVFVHTGLRGEKNVAPRFYESPVVKTLDEGYEAMISVPGVEEGVDHHIMNYVEGSHILTNAGIEESPKTLEERSSLVNLALGR